MLNIAAKLSKGEGLDSDMKLKEPLLVIYQSAEDGLPIQLSSDWKLPRQIARIFLLLTKAKNRFL